MIIILETLQITVARANLLVARWECATVFLHPCYNALNQLMTRRKLEMHNFCLSRDFSLYIRIKHVCISSGGYSNLGARGKNFQKFMLSEKKKRSDLGLDIFLPKSKCSLKKKKGLHFNFTSNFPIFLPKSRCSLKKKKGLHFNFISDFPLFLPKSRYPPKKKRSSLRIVH